MPYFKLAASSGRASKLEKSNKLSPWSLNEIILNEATHQWLIKSDNKNCSLEEKKKGKKRLKKGGGAKEKESEKPRKNLEETRTRRDEESSRG